MITDADKKIKKSMKIRIKDDNVRHEDEDER